MAKRDKKAHVSGPIPMAAVMTVSEQLTLPAPVTPAVLADAL